ncbi:hypothetical protein B0H63DRAFT_465185 [Podospora didyma]|uniref:Uncharacterized protein n=1 Tax=Podospora didyma TaxID=330526 RepID=A0AAE0NZK6_9PEZI|nr:hypothetical protein B0H63DRAFT_465185 [Podospora didyma]
MEASPLIKAHDHARAASIATQTADTTVAINEHALAAGEFANAARSTTSVEALRTLSLLEQHHKRLSELLKLPLDQPTSQQSNPDSDLAESDEKGIDAAQQSDDPKTSGPQKAGATSVTTPTHHAKPAASLSQQPRYPNRELSSSIAIKLASVRGINKTKYRGQPLVPRVSNDQAPGSLEVHSRREASQRKSDTMDIARKPTWVPPTAASDPPKPEPATPNLADEAFSRFYSTFGSLINRLSAPLAFAGLPLIIEESSTVAALEPPAAKRPSRAIEPDLSKLFSRATLRSLARDGHGPNDSFYVVPTSGHTASYASILNHENKEKRRMAASFHQNDDAIIGDDHGEDDDFVDARESQAALPPISPSFRKRLGRNRTEKDLQNVIEELHLENSSLKEMLDKLSKRLHAFELNSQSSHLALAQSLRLQRPGSPTTMSSSVGLIAAPGVPTAAEEALKKRNKELEEQLATAIKQITLRETDYDRLQQTVDKYRDRWEKLKAGAKARRDTQNQAAEGESAASPARRAGDAATVN